MSVDDSSAELEKKLEDHSRRVELSLSRFFDEVRGRSSDYHPFIGSLYDSISEFTLRGGKRMASFTTALVCEGYGFEDADALATACEAVELYRHSILIHDDLVDGDETRRGLPTINRRYADLRDERLGLGCSVFSGNILFLLSISRVLGSGLTSNGAVAVVGELTRANTEVNESQTLDLYMEGTEADQETWKIMASKRAASLFRATLRIGGVLSGASKDLSILGKAGEEMGYVFDIQDDIIDTFASSEEYGREPGSDLKSLKRPLHIVLAMKKATARQKAALKSPSTDLGYIKSILRGTGAVEDAKDIADEHASVALGLIEETGMDEGTKNLFGSLMSYMKESLSWYV